MDSRPPPTKKSARHDGTEKPEEFHNTEHNESIHKSRPHQCVESDQNRPYENPEVNHDRHEHKNIELNQEHGYETSKMDQTPNHAHVEMSREPQFDRVEQESKNIELHQGQYNENTESSIKRFNNESPPDSQTRTSDLIEVNPVTLRHYNDLTTKPDVSRDIHFFILKSTKTRIEGLIKNLENFQDTCESSELKNNIGFAINEIQNKMQINDSQMYTYHNENQSKLEYFCVAVQKYMVGQIVACNYILGTYTYKEQSNKNNSGGWKGFFNKYLPGGSGKTTESQNQKILPDFKNILEANFLREIVDRNYGRIDNSRLRLNLEENNQRSSGKM